MQRLRGMVVRGGVKGDEATIHFVDMFDIMILLEAVAAGDGETDYIKAVETRPLSRRTWSVQDFSFFCPISSGGMISFRPLSKFVAMRIRQPASR